MLPLVSLLGSAAFAQEAPAAAEPLGARLPVLQATVPAAYPPDALARGVGAAVLMELGVDAAGRVIQARVMEGSATACVPETAPVPCDDVVWAAFDAAALQAVRDFKFTPAYDADNLPTQASVVYRLRFDAQRAPTPSVVGRVLDASNEAPLADADLVLAGPEPAPGEARLGRTARTAADGAFSLAGLPDGVWSVAVSHPGYLVEVGSVTVREGVVADVTLRVKPDVPVEAARSGEVFEVVAEARSLEVTERKISVDEIRYLPGTGGDVVRAVQNLPGVARAPLGTGQLIIRGTPPEDSTYFLDGEAIPIVFHFAGFATILNADSLAEVAYLPGNYSVRYGRTLGGAVDLRTKEGLPDASRGYASVDLIQATLYAEQKIGDRWAVAISGRRSYVDAILNPILNSVSSAPIRAPRYYDAQLRVLHEPKSGGSVDILALYSDDRFRILADDSEDSAVAIGLSTTFAKVRGRWLRPFGEGWENELTAQFGPESNDFEFLETSSAYERSLSLGLRDEVRLERSSDHPVGWRLGAELMSGRESFLYDVTVFSPYEEAAECYLAPTLYAEPTIGIGPLVATPGLRLDALTYTTGYTALALDPRLGTRWSLGTSTAVKASVGNYSQFPTLRQVAPEADGNEDLGPSRSIQASVGVEERVQGWLALEGTLFHNWLMDLVVGREDRFRFFTGPPPVGPFDTDPYANDGTGKVYGAEGLVRVDLPNTTGLLSVTVSRSTRVNRPGEETELFSFDQPVVANALVSQKLPKSWRLGARARFASGNPYTPVVNRWYDTQNRFYVPVYGEKDSARLPAFWAVDVRADKEWAFKNWTLTTYLDVQNVFNTKNVDVMSWSWDYAEEQPINGLPILPSFGIRGDWGKGR